MSNLNSLGLKFKITVKNEYLFPVGCRHIGEIFVPNLRNVNTVQQLVHGAKVLIEFKRLSIES